jgi:lipoate-protein ligase A
MQPEAPSIVLGSAQPEEHVDRDAARREGVEVARRRSGGGAVLVTEETIVWVDLILPAGHDLWEADVGKAGWWVGSAWAAALESLSVPGDITVWKERLRSTDWSSRVCFAGVGPGEVLIDGKKAVGVAQRRTRSAALFQTAVLIDWRPGDLVRLLALDPDSRRRAAADLESSAIAVRRSTAELLEAFLAALPG